MKIAVIGAGGRVGRRTVQEALSRGHEVKALVRHPSAFDLTGDRLTVSEADATDPTQVADGVRGTDAVISAVGPAWQSGDPAVVPQTARSLLAALPRAGVRRLIFVGGAASLEVAPGVRLMDTPQFPDDYKPIGVAHAEALDVFRASDADVDWAFVSPPPMLEPGERTGKYRVGGDQLLTGANGQPYISMEDYAIALVDEAENGSHKLVRFTVAND
jgi:putative NADH-flavin reductase